VPADDLGERGLIRPGGIPLDEGAVGAGPRGGVVAKERQQSGHGAVLLTRILPPRRPDRSQFRAATVDDLGGVASG
jgi:hypothetical protein